MLCLLSPLHFNPGSGSLQHKVRLDVALDKGQNKVDSGTEIRDGRYPHLPNFNLFTNSVCVSYLIEISVSGLLNSRCIFYIFEPKFWVQYVTSNISIINISLTCSQCFSFINEQYVLNCSVVPLLTIR